jgi:hypothetical protein
VLDGELGIWHRDRIDFALLQRRLAKGPRAKALAAEHPESYMLFDILAAAGQDLRVRPLVARASGAGAARAGLAAAAAAVPGGHRRGMRARIIGTGPDASRGIRFRTWLSSGTFDPRTCSPVRCVGSRTCCAR